ncbi:DUF6053 domain-containing protein [Lysobacter sp. 2RAB21]
MLCGTIARFLAKSIGPEGPPTKDLSHGAR